MDDENGNGKNAATFALLTKITGDMSDLKANHTQLVDVVRKQQDLLVRIDTRQEVWATKQELSEATATWQATLQPVAAKTDAAHRRIDEHGITLSGIHEKFEVIDEQITTSRISLARMSAVAGAASLFASLVVSVVVPVISHALK